MTAWFNKRAPVVSDAETKAEIVPVAVERADAGSARGDLPARPEHAAPGPAANGEAVLHDPPAKLTHAPIGAGSASYGLTLGFKGEGKTHLAREYVDAWRRRGGSFTFVDPKAENAHLGEVAENGRQLASIVRSALEQRRPFGAVLQIGWDTEMSAIFEFITRVGHQLLVVDELHFFEYSKALKRAINTGRSRRLNIIGTTPAPIGVPPEFKLLVDWVACFAMKDPYYAEQVAERFFQGAPGVAAQLQQLPPHTYLHRTSTGRLLRMQTHAGV